MLRVPWRRRLIVLTTSVGANICAALRSATIFSNIILIEFAAVITATISNLAGLLAKATGFDRTEQWLELEPSAAARTSCRGSVLATGIDETQR